MITLDRLGGKRMQKIVSHLKKYRDEKGISQEQLAEAIGVSRKTISLMESEKE